MVAPRATRARAVAKYVEPDEDDGLLESDGGSPQQRGYGDDMDDVDDVDDQRENPGMVSELKGRGLYARSECFELFLRQINADAVQLDRDDRSYEAEDEVTALSPQLERRCEWSIY
jgi:hypothetical protein